MGMVKDVTDRFTTRYMAGMLSVIQSINHGQDGQPLPAEQRLLRITPALLFTQPGRLWQATARLLRNRGLWLLALWILGQLLLELARLPGRLLPTAWIPRYQLLPPLLAPYARFAERRLRWLRWAWLAINLHFQLELTRAQVPLQRLGKAIEHLVSMLVLCHHAAGGDASEQRVAALQCEQLQARSKAQKLLTGLWQMDRLRAHIGAVGDDVEAGRSSLIAALPPQPFAHPFHERKGHERKGQEPKGLRPS
jgi:hypothetical protein